MLNKIRSSIGNYYFRKELEKTARSRKLTNLRVARHIGLLYELNEPEDYDVIAAFVASLQQDHKEVKALGFVRNRILENRFLPKLAFDFFSEKDLNWHYKPGNLKVTDFISTDFDLLIDLSLAENLPLRYIAGLSAAKCRIGPLEEKHKECYDLMLGVRKGATLKNHIEEITHYLTIINNGDQK